ncbi:MAG: 50S ribosomal protein L7/L12 [Sphaerochaetaceae bacterium]|nr:50S ribosomal protein L7/L12 [Sphaerochaetaceae bacterium]
MVTKDEILEAVANMTVMEVSELIKAMEEKFGVTAAAATVAVAAGPAAGAAEEAEEKTEFNVVLKGFDPAKKIGAIKAVRACVPELGLKEAKDLVEAGGTVKEGVSKADAADMKAKLEAEGCTVEIQ